MRAFCFDRDMSDIAAVDMLRTTDWPNAFLDRMEAQNAELAAERASDAEDDRLFHEDQERYFAECEEIEAAEEAERAFQDRLDRGDVYDPF